ncbi:MAG: undecaprenyl-diphosphate phosphatase, partial [Myxococcales bacterium]|nr:undecaprenyl-diphosphate phosphatase [Myxococcales bacterium]
RVESFSHSPTVVGGCLLITAAILITTRYAEGKRQVLSYGAFFLIGVAQGVAVLPGISRSGSTIAAAMLLGMGGTAAFRFSFLLSMPAIAGAVVLKLGNAEAWRSLGWNALVAGTVAFLSGYIALKLLRRVVVGGYFWAFSLYLIPVGAGLLLWSTLE